MVLIRYLLNVMFNFYLFSAILIIFRPSLTYLLQSGIVKFLEHRDLPSTKICPLDLQSKDRKLRNSDLTMTYMIMVTGLAAAIAVFVGEVCNDHMTLIIQNFFFPIIINLDL